MPQPVQTAPLSGSPPSSLDSGLYKHIITDSHALTFLHASSHLIYIHCIVHSLTQHNHTDTHNEDSRHPRPRQHRLVRSTSLTSCPSWCPANSSQRRKGIQPRAGPCQRQPYEQPPLHHRAHRVPHPAYRLQLDHFDRPRACSHHHVSPSYVPTRNTTHTYKNTNEHACILTQNSPTNSASGGASPTSHSSNHASSTAGPAPSSTNAPSSSGAGSSASGSAGSSSSAAAGSGSGSASGASPTSTAGAAHAVAGGFVAGVAGIVAAML